MNHFLNQVADKVMSHDLRETLLILPNRRSGAVLRQLLVNRLPEGGFLPEISTLHAWSATCAEMELADNLYLKFELYEAYLKEMGAAAHPIEQFFGWADTLISDFNDIDNYLIEAPQLFRNLAAYEDIENFSFLKVPLSAKQTDYLRFWNTLNGLYQRFRTELITSGMGYAGLIMSQCLKALKDSRLTFPKHIAIVGFNALTAAEFGCLKILQDEHGAEVLFELDRAFQAPSKDRAGYFVRKNVERRLGKILPSERSIAESNIAISLWESPDKYGQTKSLRSLLQAIDPGEQAKTAVVLADESLLIPVLGSLPAQLENPNITMGLSLGDSSFSAWIGSLFGYRLAHQNGAAGGEKTMIRALLGEGISQLIFTAEELQELNLGRDSGSMAEIASFRPILDFVTGPSIELSRRFTTLVAWLLERLDKKTTDRRIQTAKVGAEHLLTTIQHIQTFAKSIALDDRTLLFILQESLAQHSLDMLSEAKDNLQITGLLETRVLSYDRLIICSTNEEVLPGKKRVESFIPFEIRQAHKLPGKKEKEAVFAYYFYRLAAEARRLDLIYYTGTDGADAGEKSRYIHQLEYDWKQENPNMSISHFATASQVAAQPAEEPIIERTEEVQTAIRTYLERGLSASSISQFYDDPIDWYYKYVLRLKLPDTEIDFDPATYGSMVHEVLEILYTPYVGAVLNHINLGEIESQITAAADQVFTAKFPGRSIEVGEIKLRREQLVGSIQKLLKAEKKRAERGDLATLRALELQVQPIQSVSTLYGSVNVRLKGFIDRVESRGRKWYVIDYKTGKVLPTNLDLSKPAEEVNITTKSKGLQLLFYKRLLYEVKETLGAPALSFSDIEGQIISLIRPDDQSLMLKTVSDHPLPYFEQLLSRIVGDMLKPDGSIMRERIFKYSEFEKA